MDRHAQLAAYLKNNPDKVNKVIDFHPGLTRFYAFDFTSANTELTPADVADTDKFTHWVEDKLRGHDCEFGIGGYMEHRTLYGRSPLFDTDEELRRLHLGVDIWGSAGTAVYAPLAGQVHSFQDNHHFGDYGPTIILEHHLDDLMLYSLYGHLTRESLNGLHEGKAVEADEKIGAFGDADENGSWPPHLHFQLMFDLQGKRGDYPGVGRFSEKELLMHNIPDPAVILQIPDATIVR
ncbi:peptidoglycan DD-metalloendopeptidase family protein [Mucilaginibacter sp. RS28]|uniref:Peptidoglycan DD-metalloendopeptidase family protein n=1 Tax=Mucilaginibacter straminoryzae TaxID=2932774 RepID=A0A9X1X680_9SPHI|nr:peptidoglycan DD-metalloendopeptidase family protein [Mucilaginibacter straminoryzae]MCJ8210880.1 peptidoglycan DD-metalloendopeptidase family protein [Mucilaginibacter straminoryzae]